MLARASSAAPITVLLTFDYCGLHAEANCEVSAPTNLFTGRTDFDSLRIVDVLWIAFNWRFGADAIGPEDGSKADRDYWRALVQREIEQPNADNLRAEIIFALKNRRAA